MESVLYIQGIQEILFRPYELLPFNTGLSVLFVPLGASVLWALLYRLISSDRSQYGRAEVLWARVLLWSSTTMLILISLPSLFHLFTCPICWIYTVPLFVCQVLILVYGSGILRKKKNDPVDHVEQINSANERPFD